MEGIDVNYVRIVVFLIFFEVLSFLLMKRTKISDWAKITVMVAAVIPFMIVAYFINAIYLISRYGI